MTANEHLCEFRDFLKWFQHLYPALYKLYCREILPPVSDTGVIINRRFIDADTYYMLVELTRDYYGSKQLVY